ncbi:MAG: WecB/TagA/CpsF family glycosyltransferase [Hyphomicrobiaceae bacterium]
MSRTLVGIYQRMLGSPSRQLLNVSISTLSRGQAVSVIDRHLDVGERLNVGFVNAHSLNISTHNTPYREALEQFLVLNDGLGLNLASRIKYGKAFRDNLNGTDFVPYLLSTTRHRLRIYLVGTSDHAVQVAARKMSLRFPRHIIVGYRNGFFTGLDDIEATCRTISASKADCVLVGMGNPLQELWIAEHGAKTGARLLIGVGALLDFQAGVVSRAPDWIRRIHCEWIYRLLQEPRRLARRYLIGNAVFLGRAVRDARR